MLHGVFGGVHAEASGGVGGFVGPETSLKVMLEILLPSRKLHP